MWPRRIVQAIIIFLFRLLSRVEVHGLENVPAVGGALLAVNHLGRLDAPLVFGLIEREDTTGLVADKYKWHWFYGPLVRSVRGIWVNRSELDVDALKTALNWLKAGHLLGIAPEGTRSRTHGLQPAKTGVAYLAEKAHVPVIPVAVTGGDTAVHELFRHLRRPVFRVVIGQPICLPPVERRERDAALQRNTDEIMCRLAALLPEENRGVYAGHPRLHELLAINDA